MEGEEGMIWANPDRTSSWELLGANAHLAIPPTYAFGTGHSLEDDLTVFVHSYSSRESDYTYSEWPFGLAGERPFALADGIEIRYINREQVEQLLGPLGEAILDQVIDQINIVSVIHGWPIEGIEIQHYRDPEITTWEYVVVTLVFSGSFDEADKYLLEFYEDLDILTAMLDGPNQKIIQEKLSFDITTAGVSTA